MYEGVPAIVWLYFSILFDKPKSAIFITGSAPRDFWLIRIFSSFKSLFKKIQINYNKLLYTYELFFFYALHQFLLLQKNIY